MSAKKKALLAVSFGTSVPATRKKTIDRIEEELASSFSDYRMYRAWTSGILVEKLFRRDGIRIHTVAEAMEQMRADQVTHVLVQPTHLINGIENERMKANVQAYGADFVSIVFGEPLLATEEDERQAIGVVMEESGNPAGDEALVLMGHGTAHGANAVYASLDRMLKEMGHSRVLVGTVEDRRSVDVLLEKLGRMGVKRVFLAPFMVVAGEHVLHDMAGKHEGSWKRRFEAAGFETVCVMKGLGEYPGIRKLYVTHALEAEKRL